MHTPRMLDNARSSGPLPVHSLPVAMTVALTVAVALASAGCLSQSHVIPRQELAALAQTDAQTRGREVRVIQGLAGADDPPSPQRSDPTVGANVVVVQPVHRHHGHGHGHPIPGKKAAKNAKSEGKAWLVLAAIVATGAALTEGMRYDGWVELDPTHPVHLYGWDGRYTWMPLNEITPETAAWTRKAIVRPDEGPWRELGRAPLNRRGWTFALLMGSSVTPLASGGVRGFASHIQLGRFLSPDFGVLLDVGIGWAQDDLGNVLYDSRNALELQYLPVAASIFHAGVFGQVGMGYRLDDIGFDDRRGFLLGGGAIAQLELTTRLAITARAAQTMVYGTRTTDFTVGVSIY